MDNTKDLNDCLYVHTLLPEVLIHALAPKIGSIIVNRLLFDWITRALDPLLIDSSIQNITKTCIITLFQLSQIESQPISY